MKTLARLLAMALLILPVAAFAQDTDTDADDADTTDPGGEYSRNGGYWGIGGSHVFADYNVKLTGGPLVGRLAKVEDAASLNARLGYRAHPNVSFELVFDWITSHKVTGPANGFRIGDIENYMITGNIKGIPFTGRIQPYAIAGLGPLITRREIGNVTNVFVPLATRLGLGVDFYINPKWAISIEGAYAFALYQTTDTQFGIVGGNVQYHW